MGWGGGGGGGPTSIDRHLKISGPPTYQATYRSIAEFIATYFAHSAGAKRMSKLREARGTRLHHARRSVRRAALRLCAHMYLDWLLLTQPHTATVVVQSGKIACDAFRGGRRRLERRTEVSTTLARARARAGARSFDRATRI